MNRVWKAPATGRARTRAFSGGFAASSSSAVNSPAATICPAALRLAGVRSSSASRSSTCGFVAAEHGGHAGRLERAGLGHLGAAEGGKGDGVVGGDDTGDRSGGKFADRMAGNDGVGAEGAHVLRFPRTRAERTATTSGWVTEVSVISSAVAVVPSRTRSRPAALDHSASRSARRAVRAMARACRVSGSPVPGRATKSLI